MKQTTAFLAFDRESRCIAIMRILSLPASSFFWRASASSFFKPDLTTTGDFSTCTQAHN